LGGCYNEAAQPVRRDVYNAICQRTATLIGATHQPMMRQRMMRQRMMRQRMMQAQTP